MNNGFIKLETENKIATLTFYHPKSNSFPSTLLKDLTEKINRLSDDNDVNVILLKSEGEKTFCAGASFDELIDIDNFKDGKEFFLGFAKLILAMKNCKKIIVGRIQGKAVGGGVGLVAATDYSMASNNASLRLSELALGLGPFVVGPPIERKIGEEAFSNMSLDCEWRSAEWGKQHGFYTEVYETIDELDEHINNFVQTLSKRSPEALTKLKKIFWEGTEHWDVLLEERAENSGRLVVSDYTKNFINNFKNKSSD
ncbi:MAG: enoyl-CoA hydratase/isomerase family protein [Ignavibacteriae bacterium]|nr:enoyl-CoA hydratase/isomerase family protein [Ignavibacteriota bacterium]